MPGFRIVVDEDVCGSQGQCYQRFPLLFEQRLDGDGGGRASRESYNAEERADAERMAQLCPESAISIIEVG